MLTVLLTLIGVVALALSAMRMFRRFAERQKASWAGFVSREVNGQRVLIDAEDDEMLADAVAETLRTGRPVVANRDEHGNVTVRVLGDDR